MREDIVRLIASPGIRLENEVPINDESNKRRARYYIREPVTDSMIRQEIEQVRSTGLRCYKYGFISRSGFRCGQYADVVLIDMGQLFR